MKTKILFKSVGQGDSIIINFKRKNIPKIGIVDCCKTEKSNPVLDYIVEEKIKSIDFIVLSHPHHDHFSGLLELLEYCKLNNISILNFFHTCIYVEDCIRVALNSGNEKRELVKIFKLVKQLTNNNIRNECVAQDTGYPLEIGDNLRIQFLSPSMVEQDRFLNSTNIFNNSEDHRNNPNANILSTIIKLSNNENGYALLTSDSVIKSHLRVAKKYLNNNEETLEIGQGSHHGSKYNLHKTFWKLRKRINDTPIIFSVGENNYGHVHKEVVEFFNSIPNYKIHSTDTQGHLSSITSQTAKRNSSKLNLISTLSIKNSPSSSLMGDQTFFL